MTLDKLLRMLHFSIQSCLHDYTTLIKFEVLDTMVKLIRSNTIKENKKIEKTERDHGHPTS